MNGLEEVSIDDLLNNSVEDNNNGPTFIYKKTSTKSKDTYAEDEDNDEVGVNIEDNDDYDDEGDITDNDDDEDSDTEIDAEQYENGPKFKDSDNEDTNYKLPSFIGGDGDDDDDEDDEDDEDDDTDTNYLQKFDTDIRENFIETQHPEAKNHNFEEVKHMSRVVRDENGIIIDKLHKTLPFLTKYETARILGQRAKQLNSGAKTFIKVPPNVLDGYEIAKLELEEKKIPFIIKRPIPDGTCEYWNVSDLEIL